MCGLQTSLCLDLVLILMKPFSTKESRMNYYIGVSVAVGVIQASFSVFSKSSWDDQSWSYFFQTKFALFLILVVWVSTIGSIVYASFKLCKTSISQQTRKLILVRHIASILFFILANIYI